MQVDPVSVNYLPNNQGGSVINPDVDRNRCAGSSDGFSNKAGDTNAMSCESGSRPQIKVALSGAAADTLRCLFIHGPTWDGNVPSKTGRDDLVNMGLARRGKGWQWLTGAGIAACFENGIDAEKERHESRERERRFRLEDAARSILG